jgi:hypothetical protein
MQPTSTQEQTTMSDSNIATDFRSLLAKPADSIEKPKPLPAGTYTGTINKYEYGKSKEKKTPYVRYFLQINEAGEDVDPVELDGVDLSKKQLRRDYYLTDDAEYRVKELWESCGIDGTGRSLGEILPDLIGCSVIIEVTQRNSEDGLTTYNDVGNLKGV